MYHSGTILVDCVDLHLDFYKTTYIRKTKQGKLLHRYHHTRITTHVSPHSYHHTGITTQESPHRYHHTGITTQESHMHIHRTEMIGGCRLVVPLSKSNDH